MPVRFTAFLWHPQSCNICMNHYRVGWVQDDVEPNAQLHAMESLKGWVLGFRKGAKKGNPFILEDAWRALVLPDTDIRFVYDESTHGSGIVVESLVDVSDVTCAVATGGDFQAPSTSGQVPLRTAAEKKMSSLNLDVEPMDTEVGAEVEVTSQVVEEGDPLSGGEEEWLLKQQS